jgi:hypothetical protein
MVSVVFWPSLQTGKCSVATGPVHDPGKWNLNACLLRLSPKYKSGKYRKFLCPFSSLTSTPTRQHFPFAKPTATLFVASTAPDRVLSVAHAESKHGRLHRQ